MTSLGLYSWVQQSLGVDAFVNDFGTPLTYLTAALASLLINTSGQGGLNPSPILPAWLDGSQTAPWENRTAAGTNPYLDIPETNITRYYNFTVARGTIAPDGINKSSILINGQYPGPLIEANWGDWFEITVNNNITNPEEGTSIHWHGIRNKDAPWSDGTPGISQCPIAPGYTYTYRFRADSYGSSWWHSHFSAQLLDGAWGPLVIYGPEDNLFDLDLGPVLVHDYHRPDYTKLVGNAMSNNTLTALLNPSDSTVIHGTNYECDLEGSHRGCVSNRGLAKYRFASGKTYKLRIINPSSAASPLLFSIDNHTMTVVAQDFTPVIPFDTTVLSLSAGQRTDVLVRGTEPSDSKFFIRARQPALCNYSLQPWALAAIYYQKSDVMSVPFSLPQPAFMKQMLTQCKNDPLNTTSPSYSIPVVKNPLQTYTINMSIVTNSTGHQTYTMNGSPFKADYNIPLISLASNPTSVNSSNLEWPLTPTADNLTSSHSDSNVYQLGPAGTTTRFIFINNLTFSHPMHLHGWQFQVLAEGVGDWDGSTIVNQHNPLRRDTQTIQANGYMVVDVLSDNPGAWPFHCHIAWHLSAGMSITLVQDGLAEVETKTYLDKSCTNWSKYASKTIVDEIDSGE